MTMLTVAVGGIAILLIGALISHIMLDFQTSIVRRSGHLTIYKAGYFDFGSGNPAIYGIDDYKKTIQMISDDPVLSRMVSVVTPIQLFFGIAGNEQADTSKTIFGQGVVPSERGRMRRWNDYGVSPLDPRDRPLPDDEVDVGIIGRGLAKILGMCADLQLPDCPEHPADASHAPPNPDVSALPERDFSNLTAQADAQDAVKPDALHQGFPRLDILSATASGAPNVVNFYVHHAEGQGIKDYDDSFVIMNLKLAQNLVYGRGAHGATGIVLQLTHTNQLDAARDRLISLFKQNKLDLEVHDYRELTPLYRQVEGFFGFLFSFVALIIGIVALFTIINTMTMNVMERTTEIGAMRALGATRESVRRQFVYEGALLGVFGATLGIALAMLIVFAINHSGMTWTPPTAAGRIPLQLYLLGNLKMLVGVWLGLVALAAIASLAPANRAAKMPIIDALRHV
ncbi:MAG: FtsX-like permease family protein [Parvularculaceae bacterium]